MESLRIYVRLVRAAMRGRMQYRTDFLVGVGSVILLNVVQLGMIGVILGRFQHINGWSLWEVVFLYCLWLLGHSVFSLLFWHLGDLQEYVVQGRFDQFLVRPAGVLVQFLGQGIQYMGVADVLFAATGLALAYRNLHLDWDAVRWAIFPVAVISGTAIEVGLAWIVASVSFWTLRSRGLIWVTQQFHMLVQQYPVDMFGTWFRIVVTGLLPVAFMNYYPTLVLLDKLDRLAMPWLGYLSPAVALGLLLIGSALWRRGLRSYASTGH